jgi:hypothetical protein
MTVEPVEAATDGIVEPTTPVAPSPQILAAEPSTAFWARMVVVVVVAAIVAVAVGFGVYVVLGPS